MVRISLTKVSGNLPRAMRGTLTSPLHRRKVGFSPNIVGIVEYISLLPNARSALIGALGSVIGYLGGEAAEASVFERLLWPRRFYHQLNFSSLANEIIFMTMRGPLPLPRCRCSITSGTAGFTWVVGEGICLGLRSIPTSTSRTLSAQTTS
jgi:hypothetical protein